MSRVARAWLGLVLGLCLAPAQAASWSVDLPASELAFYASWEGIEFKGVFHRYRVDLRFDPRDLAGSGFRVRVELASIDSRSADRDEGMVEPEWLDVPHHPEARFATREIRALGPGRYEASGTLTLKGVRRPLTLPFTWKERDDHAEMAARVTLRRTDFKIGEGEWASGEMIGLDVRVEAHLRLVRKGPE